MPFRYNEEKQILLYNYFSSGLKGLELIDYFSRERDARVPLLPFNAVYNRVADDLEIYIETVQVLATSGMETDNDYKIKVHVGHVSARGSSIYIIHENAIRTRVYAMYSAAFPIGLFRGLFYQTDRPEYMNYGSLGSVIAHEISHIFVQAEYGDLPGELRSWWSPSSLLNYDEKLQCLSNQYGNFVVPELRGKHLNPKKTRDEDMADLAGMKISYDTYINRVQEKGPEPLLPGLKYSPNQLFWIASAIRHCSKYSSEDLERYIDNYQWSPQQFRVNGPLQNLKEFAFDFGCRKGTKMNPEDKCDIW